MPEQDPQFWTEDKLSKFLVYGVALPVLLAGTVAALAARGDDAPNAEKMEIVRGIPAQVEAKGTVPDPEHPDNKKYKIYWVDLEQCHEGNEAVDPTKLHKRSYDPVIGSVAVGCAFNRVRVDRVTYGQAHVGKELRWPGKSDVPITVAG